MNLNNLLNTAILASLAAGDKIMEIYETGDFGVDMKSDDSPLTIADIASHNIILSFLEKTRIPVLSEEGKDIPYTERKDWNQLWIVDPIDGTKEFIKKNGEFTVNIALIENQKPVLGVVYAPALDELYFSSTEIGAYQYDGKLAVNEFDLSKLISQSEKLPKQFTNDDSRITPYNSRFTIVASRSHISPETEAYVEEMRKQHGEVDLISRGSSLKLCMVASGKANCYPRFAPTMEWDTAAGQAICMHAGFDVLDWSTKKTMIYNRELLLNNWFLVK